MPPILIVGAGGHGRVCAEIAEATGSTVAGFCDTTIAVGSRVNGISVVASSLDGLPDAFTGEIFIAIGDNQRRSDLGTDAEERGYSLATLVHPAAIVSPSAAIGAGSVVMAGVVINANAKIGRLVILNTGCTLDHDNEIGDAAQVCPGVHCAGTVRIGAGAFIGTGATLVPGITIGRDAIVGAGTVVLRDVAAGTTVIGNPARSLSRTPVRDIAAGKPKDPRDT